MVDFRVDALTESTLSSFEDVERQINRTIRATENLVDRPLENLIRNLGRAAEKGNSASRSLERFGEDLLTAVTENLVQNVFGSLGGGSVRGQNQSRSSGLDTILAPVLGSIFSGQPGLGQASGLGGFGSNPVNVTVFNNSNAQAQVSERTNSRGQREVEIMIDNMVASSLSQGQQTRSVLRSIFGIDNLLRSR